MAKEGTWHWALGTRGEKCVASGWRFLERRGRGRGGEEDGCVWKDQFERGGAEGSGVCGEEGRREIWIEKKASGQEASGHRVGACVED